MHTTDIQALEARQKLGELLERVYYQSAQFRIIRKDKPMARLVDEPFMQALEKLLEADPALVDTLALMLNAEVLEIIELGQREWEKGERTPLAQALHQT